MTPDDRNRSHAHHASSDVPSIRSQHGGQAAQDQHHPSLTVRHNHDEVPARRGEHESHEHGGHDKHVGHSVEMFRDKFWGTLVLSVPAIIWSPMIQHWFGYEAPGGSA